MSTGTQMLEYRGPKTTEGTGEDVAATASSLVVSIVGSDGCGKSSTFEAALAGLAARLRVAGIGDRTLSGGPDEPLHERLDIPRSRVTHAAGQLARGLRWQGLYKNVKFLELTGRTRLRDWIVQHDAPDVILTDGESTVNAAAWAAASFYRTELQDDDEALAGLLRRLTGEETIPMRETPYHLRRAPQLLLLSRLRLGRFTYPDLIILLELDPAVALERIRARGKPLQAHETEAFLGELGRAYARVCAILEERRGIPVVRLRVDRLSHEETVQRVVAATMDLVERARAGETTDLTSPDRIEVVATTMSGSIRDQAKVGRIGPEFRARTARPVCVHKADTHAEAQSIAHDVVARGGRTVVSAGGAGTFNAVLEGAHVAGRIPDDLRLAFLRKGSADLIGKVLGIPDELPDAVHAIVGGIESGDTVDADVLVVDGTGPDGLPQTRHVVGFGGFGVFGDIPRFTESRAIKLYKGVLGTLFGDLGPFFTGLALSSVYWQGRRLRGHVPALSLTLDGTELPTRTWVSVIVMNGDLGPNFPLGRGLGLASGTFRVIALPYRGPAETVRQAVACKTAAVLDDPRRYGALVREVRSLTVRPAGTQAYMVNIDGLKLMARGSVSVSVDGTVHLVPGRLET